MLTRYLAKELRPRGIPADVVAPGAIETEFVGGLVRANPEVNKRVAEMTALGRADGPDDIGPMIAALLSDDNRWVNGQHIEVSGGMYPPATGELVAAILEDVSPASICYSGNKSMRLSWKSFSGSSSNG
jgi:NAD(P)-dependent dehydrogenase (short-subunit alcohol dehydrogenase family)